MSGSATVRLDRALVSFYRLLIVTVPLTEAGGFGHNSQCKYFGMHSVPPFGGIGSCWGVLVGSTG